MGLSLAWRAWRDGLWTAPALGEISGSAAQSKRPLGQAPGTRGAVF